MSQSNLVAYVPTCQEILSQFEDVVAFRGGQFQKHHLSENRMFLRAYRLDGLSDEVAKNDQFDGGIALRVSGPQISVHLFTFRQVCKNGSIISESHDTKRMLRLPENEFRPESKFLCMSELREILLACASPEAFSKNMRMMRQMRNTKIDTALNIVSHFEEHLDYFTADVLQLVLNEFFQEEDMTLYGVMNAITAAARQTKDAQTRWDLEELGGGIGARLLPVLNPDSSRARARLAAGSESRHDQRLSKTGDIHDDAKALLSATAD